VIAWTSVPTPIDDFTVAATETGVVGISFGAWSAAVRTWETHGRVRPGTGDDAMLAHGVREVREWAAGHREVFESPLDWSLTSGVQQRVLRTLYETVPFGTTVTYGELASRSGLPGEARLVGQIMGSNPIPIIVPCHRVLASDGLGGYGPGLELKRRILVLERVLQPSLFD
jgi:methylated-DNA-[protein]-cysteine S-methyltransferase